MLKFTTIAAVATLVATAPALAAHHDHAEGHDHAVVHDHGVGHVHGAHAKPSAQSATANAAALTGPGAVIKVSGLICDFCAQTLTKTFKKQAAIRAVHVDLDAKEVRLAFKSGLSLDNAAIGKLIKDAGYNVVAIKRRPA